MSTAPEDPIDDFRVDRTQFSVVRLTDPDDTTEYWLSRPVEERLRALELLRRTFYGYTSYGRYETGNPVASAPTVRKCGHRPA